VREWVGRSSLSSRRRPMAVQTDVVLEPAAQELADAISRLPFLCELELAAARAPVSGRGSAPRAWRCC
jgi:hypothetical protein